MKIAVEGCCHGELDSIYAAIEQSSERPELLLVCGDFQSVRNSADLACMAVPDKFKKMGGFQDYYTGVKTAPVLTIFIGGNHEASNYLQELYHGGWVAPNIYYLGRAGCVWYHGLRIMGISGIWNPHSFLRPPIKINPPYDRSEMRSVYHVRRDDFLEVACCDAPMVMLSHDWPQGIPNYGDLGKLLRWKPFFKADIESGKLGSPVNREILFRLKPRYWFSAHLHVEYTAIVKHGQKRKLSDAAPKNTDEIELDLDDLDDLGDSLGEEEEKEEKVTEFHALDKCLPKRKFLTYKDIPADETHPSFSDDNLHLDKNFLCVQKALQRLKNSDKAVILETMRSVHGSLHPTDEFWDEMRILITEETVKFSDDLIISKDAFVMTAPPDLIKPKGFVNPQTEAYEKLLSVNPKK